MTGAACVQAQVWQQSKAVKSLAAKPQHRAAGQAWWGYVESYPTLSGLGVQDADTYHCAIFIPGDEPTAGGHAIHAMRFFLDAYNVTGVKAWVSSSLPSSADAADIEVVPVDNSSLGGLVEVSFKEPHTVSGSGVYVGYSFTITKVEYESDAYPISTVDVADAPNALVIKTDRLVPSWSDMAGQGFGRLYLQVLVDGDFAGNGATPLEFRMPVMLGGSTTTVSLPVQGYGINAVENIDYTITSGGVTGAEQHATTTSPIDFLGLGYFNIELPADETVGQISEKTLTITKVNGAPNEAEVNSVAFRVATIDRMVDHRVAVEENTGTGCGWCPRGLVGMEKLRKHFGDDFVGIGIHQYNSSDAMYIARNSYAPLYFEGAPQCIIERSFYADPYYGTNLDICDDVQAAMDYPALAGIEVQGVWNADQSQVEATATVQSLIEGASYGLEFVLIGDGLKGTGSGWNQANYYVQYSQSQLPADLAQFGAGGVNGRQSLTGWTFNDVALSSSYVNGSNQATGFENMSATEPATSTYTLTLPATSALKAAIDTEKVYVVALLVNTNGTIENAVKAKVVAAGTDGISANKSDARVVETARYTLDGRQVTAPQRGLHIIKMSDGTVRKVRY